MRLAILLLPILATSVLAAPIDYARDVKPILRERCYNCHGTLKQKAKLRLDSGQLIHKGGSSGPAIVPGKSAESLLIEKVSDADAESRMPPELKPLTAGQIETIKAWIDQGAKYPADDKPEADPRDHWAFRTPVRPAVPTIELGKERCRCLSRRRVEEARTHAAKARRQALAPASRLSRPDRFATNPGSRSTHS